MASDRQLPVQQHQRTTEFVKFLPFPALSHRFPCTLLRAGIELTIIPELSGPLSVGRWRARLCSQYTSWGCWLNLTAARQVVFNDLDWVPANHWQLAIGPPNARATHSRRRRVLQKTSPAARPPPGGALPRLSPHRCDRPDWRGPSVPIGMKPQAVVAAGAVFRRGQHNDYNFTLQCRWPRGRQYGRRNRRW